MIAIINLITMLLAGILFLFFYVKSVSPAALEKKIGEIAYKKCAQYRSITGIFMTIVMVNYILYVFFPIKQLNLPEQFSWGWIGSILIGVGIGIPSGYLFYRGMKDAGEETMTPKKEHSMYKGIYKRIRHPQAVGEVILWWVLAFFLNSPFLVIFSFFWLPVWYIMCLAEEKDLVMRYGKPFKEYQKNTGMFIPKFSSN